MLILYAMAIANALFLAFLLSTKPRFTNPVANRWLAGFILTVAGLMADDLRDMAHIQASPFLDVFGFSNWISLAIGPCLYFSVLSFTEVQFRFRPRYSLHFLPWLLNGLVLLVCLLTVDIDNLAAVTTPTTYLFWVLEAFIYVALVQSVVYVVVALRRLADHNRHIQLFASATDRINLGWLQKFIAGVPLMLLVWGAVLFFDGNRWVAAYPLVLFGAFYYLGYHALNQPAIYSVSPQVAAEIEAVIDQTETPTTTAPLLAPVEVDQWKAALIELMETRKPYTENDLTLPRLAGLLDLSTHKLSFVINQGFNENFFQFVNRYRVEESKRLLTDPRKQHFNILEIGYEAGFNSKTAFNTSFKRMTGVSPSEYQKKDGLSGGSS